jgi:hypothetical protein
MKKALLLGTITALFSLSLMLSGCEEPGEGEKAERGYEVCQPIIDALARYSANTGAYPDNLNVLVPNYLAEVPQQVNDIPIRYRKTATSYWLRFSYEGPGMNDCEYTPETGWVCHGYY